MELVELDLRYYQIDLVCYALQSGHWADATCGVYAFSTTRTKAASPCAICRTNA
jgi:hypothetical protein